MSDPAETLFATLRLAAVLLVLGGVAVFVAVIVGGMVNHPSHAMD